MNLTDIITPEEFIETAKQGVLNCSPLEIARVFQQLQPYRRLMSDIHLDIKTRSSMLATMSIIQAALNKKQIS